MRRSCMLSFCHPAVPGVFFAAVLLLTMLIAHPVFAAISLIGALWLSFLVRGGHATGNSIRAMIPLTFLIVIVNPFISSSGTTIVMHVFGFAITLESLIYGLTMGMMISAVMVWCEDAACALDDEAIMVLMGRPLPRVSLIISMVARLIPAYISRGREISVAEKANVAAYGAAAHSASSPTRANSYADASAECSSAPSTSQTHSNHTANAHTHNYLQRLARRLGILLSWSLESSIQTADSMTARGWSSEKPRSIYQKVRFSHRDAVLVMIVIVLGICFGIAAYYVCSQFSFYPQMKDIWAAQFIIPYGFAALFVALPSLYQIVEVHQWTR